MEAEEAPGMFYLGLGKHGDPHLYVVADYPALKQPFRKLSWYQTKTLAAKARDMGYLPGREVFWDKGRKMFYLEEGGERIHVALSGGKDALPDYYMEREIKCPPTDARRVRYYAGRWQMRRGERCRWEDIGVNADVDPKPITKPDSPTSNEKAG